MILAINEYYYISWLLVFKAPYRRGHYTGASRNHIFDPGNFEAMLEQLSYAEQHFQSPAVAAGKSPYRQCPPVRGGARYFCLLSSHYCHSGASVSNTETGIRVEDRTRSNGLLYVNTTCITKENKYRFLGKNIYRCYWYIKVVINTVCLSFVQAYWVSWDGKALWGTFLILSFTNKMYLIWTEFSFS